jgi:hypothetical protein
LLPFLWLCDKVAAAAFVAFLAGAAFLAPASLAGAALVVSVFVVEEERVLLVLWL